VTGAGATDVADAAPQLAALVLIVAAFAGAAVAARRRLARGLSLVPSRPHAAVPWQGGDVALAVVIYLLAAVLVAKVVGPGAPLATRIVGNVVSSLVAVAAVAGWLRVQGADARALGFVGDGWRADVGLAVGSVGLVLLPLLTFAAVLDRLVPYEHPIVDFLDGRRDPLAVVVVIVSAIVVAPLAEEFFFRRVLQGWLEKRLPDDPVGPVLVPAIAFAAAHAGQGLAWVALVPLAIVLGVIARRTGSIVPCILLHALFNAVSVGLLLLQPDRPPTEGG
jgi:membrane protease YdiL (CAAX protease family)